MSADLRFGQPIYVGIVSVPGVPAPAPAPAPLPDVTPINVGPHLVGDQPTGGAVFDLPEGAGTYPVLVRGCWLPIGFGRDQPAEAVLVAAVGTADVQCGRAGSYQVVPSEDLHDVESRQFLLALVPGYESSPTPEPTPEPTPAPVA